MLYGVLEPCARLTLIITPYIASDLYYIDIVIVIKVKEITWSATMTLINFHVRVKTKKLIPIKLAVREEPESSDISDART